MDTTTTLERPDFSRALKPFALPLGLASPMWFAYGAAASVGATWWWMSRMTRFVSPSAVQAAPKVEPMLEVVAEPVVVMLEAPVAATILEASTNTDATPERFDELTLLRGVGPRVADALVARGVTTFAQLAAWTEEELAAFDAELKLLGRSKRYDFIGQAREMASA